MRLLPFILTGLLLGSPPALSRDFFLSIGGGYAPQGNQASLEANVLFFQRLLSTQQVADATQKIYFADGFDSGDDLQVLQREADQANPTIKALSAIFRLGDNDELVYRNHEVPKISGGIRAADIREGLEAIGSQLASGDRLFVYVTAHGSPAVRGRDPRDTSITCWGKKALPMTEFSSWLDELPQGITIVSVMAQCYCGGFANTIFAAGDEEQGFAQNVRCGFFAQQHDLPAAGCRPDVENDEEYSSYFWGAFLGASRTGKAVGSVDCNGDGRISLAEAHAFAVVASETIDIPLRTSEALLRRFSRIAGYETEVEDREVDPDASVASEATDNQLAYFSGTIDEIAARGRPEETRMIVGLAEKLSIPVAEDVAEVTRRYEQQRQEYRDARRSGSRRPRGFSVRRRLQAEIIEKWPELERPEDWASAEVLQPANQEAFLGMLEQLEGYAVFFKSQEDRSKARKASVAMELKEVKFRRLIQQLENVVLAQNIAALADPEVVERYQEIVAAEEGFLGTK